MQLNVKNHKGEWKKNQIYSLKRWNWQRLTVKGAPVDHFRFLLLWNMWKQVRIALKYFSLESAYSSCSAILQNIVLPCSPAAQFSIFSSNSLPIFFGQWLFNLVLAFLSEAGFYLFSNMGNFGISTTLPIFYFAEIIQIWIMGMLLIYGNLVSDVSNYNYISPDHGLCWLGRNWYPRSRNYSWSLLKFLNNFAK